VERALLVVSIEGSGPGTPRSTGAPTVLWLVGDVDLDTAPELRWGLLEALTTGSSDLVIDASGVRFMAACGVGALMTAQRCAQLSGRSVRLRSPSPPVRRLWEVLGIDAELPIEPR